MEYQNPQQFVNSVGLKVLYYDANGTIVPNPILAVKKVSLEYDENGNLIKTFTELSITGFLRDTTELNILSRTL